MPSTSRCVFGCNTTGVTIHNFPNPRIFQERFRIWVGLAGASVSGLTDMQIYKNRKVCDKHFAEQDRNRNSRLNALAIPHLHIPMPLLSVASEANPNMQSDFQSSSVQITGATTPSMQKEFYVCDDPVPTTSKASFASQTSVERSSIEVQDKNTRRPLSEIQEITAPPTKKPCVADFSWPEKETREIEVINANNKSENGCQIEIESNDNDNSNNDLNSNHMECMDHDDSYVDDPNINPNTIRTNIEKRVQSNKPEANGSVLSTTPLTPNICRICLATDVKMYPIKDFQLRRIYQQLTGVVLNPEDQLPNALCWECVGRLISAHKFRNKALRAHSLLTDIHIQTHANIQDFIISQIKCYSGLESTLTTKHFSNDDVNLVIFEDPDATAEEKTSAFEEHDNNNCSDVFTEVIVDNIDHMGPEEVILEVNDTEVSAKYYTEPISDKDRPLKEVFIENNINKIKGPAESESNENEFLEDSEDERTHGVLAHKIKKSRKFISNKAKQYICSSDAIESWRLRNDSHFSSGSLRRRPGGHALEERRSAGAPLMCDQCGKIFRTHTGLKPFECESCGKFFTALAKRRSRVEYVP